MTRFPTKRSSLAALAAAAALSAAIVLSPASALANGGDTPILKINGLMSIISQADIPTSLQAHLLDDLRSAKHILHRSHGLHLLDACFPIFDAAFLVDVNTGFPMPPMIDPWFARQWLGGLEEIAFEIGCFWDGPSA